jgi:hypothetical protein
MSEQAEATTTTDDHSDSDDHDLDDTYAEPGLDLYDEGLGYTSDNQIDMREHGIHGFESTSGSDEDENGSQISAIEEGRITEYRDYRPGNIPINWHHYSPEDLVMLGSDGDPDYVPPNWKAEDGEEVDSESEPEQVDNWVEQIAAQAFELLAEPQRQTVEQPPITGHSEREVETESLAMPTASAVPKTRTKAVPLGKFDNEQTKRLEKRGILLQARYPIT